MCESCGKPKCNCGKDTCSTGAAVVIKNATEYTNFRKVLVPASVRSDETEPPKPGEFCNVLLVFEATGNAYMYSSDGVPTQISDRADIRRLERLIEAEAATREDEDKKLAQAIIDEADIRSSADREIWTEIETIEASSDVVDVVGSYAELQQYDTSKLHDNDLIKVLQDETHDDAITYYRWSTATDAFTYVGAEGPYYTCSETDALLGGKQDKLIAGTNIQIAADGKTISATDTTYANFVGATSQDDGSAGLVPAPTTSDVAKYLKGDGTWSTVTEYQLPPATANTLGGIKVGTNLSVTSDGTLSADAQPAILYSTTGQNTDGAMTQKAATDALGGKQDTLTAGSNISISGGVISATDTTYTAGTNISIDANNSISASIPIDTALDALSGNPVANSTLTAIIGDVEAILQRLNSGAGVA